MISFIPPQFLENVNDVRSSSSSILTFRPWNTSFFIADRYEYCRETFPERYFRTMAALTFLVRRFPDDVRIRRLLTNNDTANTMLSRGSTTLTFKPGPMIVIPSKGIWSTADDECAEYR